MQPYLKPGDTIGLATPSSPLFPGRLDATKVFFESLGFKVNVGKNNTKTNRYLAGMDEERAADINDFYQDLNVKAIIATGGGYGSQRILPYLDYTIIKANPKPIIGHSDTTALQLGLYARAGIVSYSGFTGQDVHEKALPKSIEQMLLNFLYGANKSVVAGKTVVKGVVEGVAIGGNLGCLCSLMGTPYQPDFQDSILFIEEVRQEPYVVDSLLSQLSLAGVFDKVKGVIFCLFEKCDAHYYPDRDGTVENVINEYASRLKVPCIKNFSYGHGDAHQFMLPIGKTIKLDATVGIVYV